MDKLDNIRVGVPYIETCKECGEKKVTTWSGNGFDVVQNHKKNCSILKELRKKYK